MRASPDPARLLHAHHLSRQIGDLHERLKNLEDFGHVSSDQTLTNTDINDLKQVTLCHQRLMTQCLRSINSDLAAIRGEIHSFGQDLSSLSDSIRTVKFELHRIISNDGISESNIKSHQYSRKTPEVVTQTQETVLSIIQPQTPYPTRVDTFHSSSPVLSVPIPKQSLAPALASESIPVPIPVPSSPPVVMILDIPELKIPAETKKRQAHKNTRVTKKKYGPFRMQLRSRIKQEGQENVSDESQKGLPNVESTAMTSTTEENNTLNELLATPSMIGGDTQIFRLTQANF